MVRVNIEIKRNIYKKLIKKIQREELRFVFYYLWYAIEWLYKFFIYGGSAKYHVSFEREIYENQDNEHYIENREPFAFIEYIENPYVDLEFN